MSVGPFFSEPKEITFGHVKPLKKKKKGKGNFGAQSKGALKVGKFCRLAGLCVRILRRGVVSACILRKSMTSSTDSKWAALLTPPYKWIARAPVEFSSQCQITFSLYLGQKRGAWFGLHIATHRKFASWVHGRTALFSPAGGTLPTTKKGQTASRQIP